jgi:uncharacterized OB-fold protein
MSDAPTPPVSPEPRRPVPVVHEHERPFWTGGARGELMVQRCAECGRFNHPPTLRCRHDHSARLEWTAVSGRGRVEAWSVNEHQWFPDFPVPYVVGLVALAEDAGARLLTNVVGAHPGEIRHGMEVRVTFVRVDGRQDGSEGGGDGASGDEVWIPLFEPISGR